MSSDKGIRDNLHGYVVIPHRFLTLIDTKEFQRLRHIKQLALATQVFPGAEHTRYSHSIGTFHLMRRVLDHFYSLGIAPSLLSDQREYDAILAAALLHDIGHGPFSHVFEEVLAEYNGKDKSNSHVDWTIKILEDDKTELRAAMKIHFDGIFWKEVARYIRGEAESDGPKPDSLWPVLASLISGQFDVDRMDYVLRDAHNIGVTYGRVDIDRLIMGLDISVDKLGKPVLCFKEDYLSDLEEFLYSRFQMYRNIYYHPYKLCTEAILRKILTFARELFRQGILPVRDIPRPMVNLFSSASLTVEEYCCLDDHVVLGAIRNWTQLTEPELACFAVLCRSLFSHVEGFTKVPLRDYRDKTVIRFKDRLRQLIHEVLQRDFDRVNGNPEPIDKAKKLKGQICELTSKKIEDQLFYVQKQSSVTFYNEAIPQETIYILRKNGCLGKLNEASSFVSALCNVDINGMYGAVYIHIGLLQNFISGGTVDDLATGGVKTIMDRIDGIVASAKGKVEIEKKYRIRANYREVRKQILSSLLQQGYEMSVAGKPVKIGDSLPSVEQVDTYYDTDDGELRRRNSPIRIRKVKGGEDYCWTFKLPTKSESSGEAGQFERFEEEERTNYNEITNPRNSEIVKSFLHYYNSLVSEEYKIEDVNKIFAELKPMIRITNRRTKLEVANQDRSEVYEVVFDDVSFSKNGTSRKGYREHQVEIEVVSANISRLNMLKMISALEKDLGDSLEQMIESKYEVGWQKLYN